MSDNEPSDQRQAGLDTPAGAECSPCFSADKTHPTYEVEERCSTRMRTLTSLPVARFAPVKSRLERKTGFEPAPLSLARRSGWALWHTGTGYERNVYQLSGEDVSKIAAVL